MLRVSKITKMALGCLFALNTSQSEFLLRYLGMFPFAFIYVFDFVFFLGE